MRYVYKKKILLCCGVMVLTLMIILHPSFHTRRQYEYILKEDILDYLHEEVMKNYTNNAVVDCDYRDTIEDDTTLPISLVDADLYEGHRIKEGGEYSPQDCKPKYSTAIIVPYRGRAEQLRAFLLYMHMFFRRQKIHYRIYIIEQVDSRPFNRAKLLNIGTVAAMKAGYPCLVLHDVDLLPLRPANVYACTENPRHMSSSINKFRYILPHLNLFGGVVAILSSQYRAVNGMSNEYYSLGEENEDLYARLEANHLRVCRFEPATSKYHMFSHGPQSHGVRGYNLRSKSKSKFSEDGLSSLKYTEVATVLHPLFTHIMVDL